MSTHEFTAEPPLVGELQPEAEYTRILQRAFLEFDQETRDEVRTELWTATDKLLANIMPEEQRQGIKIGAGIMEWYCLGQPGDDLPRGLVPALDGHGNVEYRLDERIPFINHSLSEVAECINDLGFTDTLKTIERKIEASKPEVHEAIRGIIEASAEYRLLMSFESNNTADAPLPLTPFWRQIRGAQIEGEVRTRHQLSETDEILHGTPAANDLRRHLRHLDDETMSRVNPQTPEDEVARARRWAMPYLAEAYTNCYQGKGKTLDRIAYDPEIGVLAYAKGEDESYTELYDIAEDAAKRASAELYVGSKEQRPVVIDFLYSVMAEIGDPRNSGSIRRVVEAAIEESTADVYFGLLRSTQNTFALFSTTYDDYVSLLHAPDMSVVEDYVPRRPSTHHYRQALNGDWRTVFSDAVSLATKRELWEDQNHIIGHVEEYGPDNFRGSGRLIMGVAAKHDTPHEYEGKADIRLKLSGGFYNDTPYIPGYQLVAWPKHDTYEFIVDPAGDPYSRCDVIIDQNRLADLIGIYENLGLVDLVKNLQSTPSVTVSQLSELIARTSVYHLPDEVGDFDLLHPVFNSGLRTIGDLDSFYSCVSDGVLYVQCTGASQFLKLSLDSLFEDHSAHTIGGNVLWSHAAVINAAGHQQTIFNHAGKRYILDATPGGGRGEEFPGGFLPRAGYQADHYAQTVERSVTDSPTVEQKAGLVAVQEATVEQQITELHQSLHSQLQAYFEVNSPHELYETLLRLPSHDPVRRTMELFVQFKNGVLTHAELESRVEYLSACEAADLPTKKRYKIDHYSVNFLGTLSHMGGRLSWLGKLRQRAETE